MSNLDIMEHLPLLIPIFILELVLAVTALVNVLRAKSYKVLNRSLWIVIVLVIQIIGPISYFIFGRSDD